MSTGVGPDVAQLADLDAGVLDADRARAVRARAVADPASAHVLEALAATRADLGALPPLAVPGDVLAQWINETTESPGSVIYITYTRSSGVWWLRRALWGVAALVAGLVVVVGGGHFASPATDPTRVDAVDTVGLAAAGAAATGTFEVGRLGDPGRLAGCLRAAGIPEAVPLGGRPVLLGDRPGILLVLPAGVLGRVRVVVVEPGCGPDGATVLAEATVGR
ncbi:MAG: hypothetical protein AB7G09_10420 [Pseudonocardia sp.]